MERKATINRARLFSLTAFPGNSTGGATVPPSIVCGRAHRALRTGALALKGWSRRPGEKACFAACARTSGSPRASGAPHAYPRCVLNDSVTRVYKIMSTIHLGGKHEASHFSDAQWREMLDEDSVAFSTISLLLASIVGLGTLGMLVVVAILVFG